MRVACGGVWRRVTCDVWRVSCGVWRVAACGVLEKLKHGVEVKALLQHAIDDVALWHAWH
jgi:hypothetical protein